MNFVIGHPRSGTALVSSILNAESPHRCRHEYLVERSNLALIHVASDYYHGRCTERAVSRILRLYGKCRAEVDSNWKLTWILRPLLARFPNAKVIHLTRNPWDNVRACFNLDYYGVDAFRHFLTLDWPMRKRFLAWHSGFPRIRRRDWEELNKFERNCVFWSETHALILKAFRSNGNYLRVRVEDLVDDVGVARSMFLHLDLPVPRDDKIGQILTRRANEKPRTKRAMSALGFEMLPPAKFWAAARRNRIETLCGDVAAALQYDL